MEASSSSILAKGKACTSCRRRKIRCDGCRPVCGQCEITGKGPSECGYTDVGRTRTQVLEENIAHLEQRIQDLESPEGSTSIFLHNPYNPPEIVRDRPVEVRNQAQSSEIADFVPLTPIEEVPPVHIAQELIGNFLAHSSVAGFFLNPTRFQQSAQLLSPTGRDSRLAPALLSAVYLWGQCLSPVQGYDGNKATFLTRTMQQSAAVLRGAPPQRVIHTIQAEALLAHYLFWTGDTLAGARHAAAALALATTAGLHRTRTIGSAPPADLKLRVASLLPPSTDAIEEGERINAFWAVYALNCYWGAALGTPLGIIPSSAIDTPWPLDASDYSLSIHPSQALADAQRMGTTAPALVAKGAILFARATLLIAQCKTTTPPPAIPPPALTELSATIDRFTRTFPPGVDARAALLAQTLAHAATIRLHSPFPAGEPRRLRAARAIVDLVETLEIQRFQHVNAIMGTLWVLACEMFIQALTRQRTSFGGDRVGESEEGELTDYLQRAFIAMAMFALDCPLIGVQLQQIQERYTRM